MTAEYYDQNLESNMIDAEIVSLERRLAKLNEELSKPEPSLPEVLVEYLQGFFMGSKIRDADSEREAMEKLKIRIEKSLAEKRKRQDALSQKGK